MHLLVDVNATFRNLIPHLDMSVNTTLDVNAMPWTASDIYKHWQSRFVDSTD